MSEQPMAFEEVPGSRTTQQAIDQPQRERIAYEELQPGDIIQEGDQWQHESFRWKPFASLDGSCVQVRHTQRARRPHNITQVQSERDEARKAVTQMMVQLTNQAEVLAEVRADEKRLFDDLELLRSEYAKLQRERDELRAEMDTVKGDRMNLREALAAEQRAHTVTMASGLQACKERDEACKERDLARSEVARLSTELWSRKPLEDRVASLVEELANAREDFRKLAEANAENADQFAEHTAALVRQRDGFDAEVQRLQEVVRNLYGEPTARQVQDMLRTWATELDWSAGCFDSVGREQIDTIQKTLVAVIERIETMIHPEGGTDGE